MDVKVDENNHKEADSFQYQESIKVETHLRDDEQSDKISANNCTNRIKLQEKHEITQSVEKQEDYINISSAKSELESEATNLSSTLDSRDDENLEFEKECESSLDLSYKNKSLPNSVESSLDNTENTLEFHTKIIQPNSQSFENSSTNGKEEHLFITKINGSKPVVENHQTKEKTEDGISIYKKDEIVSKENFMLDENSCSSSSSSVGLVIDQQPEFPNTNTITSQIIERDKEQIEENNCDIEENSTHKPEQKSQVEVNADDSVINQNNTEECSNDTNCSENITTSDNTIEEKVCKINNLKRRFSFCKENDDSSPENENDCEKNHSPKHKIIHLDDKYLNTETPSNCEEKIVTSTSETISDISKNDKKLEDIQVNEKEIDEETDDLKFKNSLDLRLDISSPILRKQLVIQNPDNDPGGVSQRSPSNISSIAEDTSQFDTPSSTTVEEQIQNDNRNFRFNVPLSNFGNNYLYEKNDKLVALNSSENLTKINQEKLTVPNKVTTSNENTENLNEIQDFSLKTNVTDFSNNLILKKLESHVQTKNIDILNTQGKSSNELEKSPNTNTTNFCKKLPAINDTLIDLTEDTVETSSTNSNLLQHTTTAITSKEKILQDWSKTKSLPQPTNQQQISQDLNKQKSSSDLRRLDDTPFSNQVESSIINRLDTVTNYPRSSKNLNNPSWKFSLKYGKQNKNSEKLTKKSLKRSSKNLHQNNKNSRQSSLSKKFKEYPVTTSSKNYRSDSIINSSPFSLPNKLNPPVIPPVYELSHTLNRHTEYKCSKCLNSNFKNIRDLENHHKFCLYNSNSNESIFLNPLQHQQLGINNNNNSNNNSNNTNSRISQFSTGINNLMHNVEDVLNMPKESNITNFRNLLNKQQPPLFNINDKPIEITPNLNHYLNQVEQKHKNLLHQHHHLNHNQNLFSHSLDETIKRNFLQNDTRQQNLILASEQKLNSDNHSSRYGGFLNSGFQSKKKLQNLQQQQLPPSFLDNGNILDYPIIQDSSNIFEINGSPLNFNTSALQKPGNVGVIKGLRRFSNSGIYSSNIDFSSNSLSVLSKQQLDNTPFSSTMQQKTDSLEPIMLKVKQNQFSPILPPEQLLNKLATSTLSTSLSSSASSSFQESSSLNINFPEVSESHLNTEKRKERKSIALELQNNEINQIQNKNVDKEMKDKTNTQNEACFIENFQLNSLQTNNNENTKSNSNSVKNIDKKTKKLFLCSSCGSYHENWNLFLHMREMHKRHICLVCLRMFPTAEQLTVHLEMKHDIEQNHFESQEKLIRSTRDSCYLMCCSCEHIFTEHDDFYQHICANYLKPCSLCGFLGKHAQSCKYATNEHKRNKRSKKMLHKKLQQNKQTLSGKTFEKTYNNQIKTDSSNSNDISKINHEENENLKIRINEELQQYNNCDIIPDNQNNSDLKTGTTNDEHNSDSNNGSDSDSNNKFNGYLEHFNYNDNDLINLYKSNRLANLAKQKEKEEADAQTKSLDNQNYEISENLLSDNILHQNITSSELGKSTDDQLVCENSKNIIMPKLTLKISKELFNRAQHLADDSEDHSSTESTDDGDNEDENVKSDVEEKGITEVLKENPLTSEAGKMSIIAPDQESESSTTLQAQNLENECSVNKNLETSNTNSQNIEEIENEKMEKDDENKKEKLIDDNKSDSDMDIDVTCNQGGDVGPISSVDMKHETQQIVSNATLSKEDLTNVLQISENSPKLVVQEISTNNENISNINEVLQPDKESINENSELDSSNKTDTDKENNESKGSFTPPLERSVTPIKKILTDGVELASEDIQISELSLDAPLDKIPMVTLLRIMLKITYPICLYCNHARRIAVNGNSLALHMLSSHRFSATVDSITAEELLPGTIITKLKCYLNELDSYYFNMETYCNINKDLNTVCPTIDEKIFECFSCRFSTRIHKELYLHNRKMHLRTAILCFMCRSNFYSYSEILCHICPGAQFKVVLFDIKFRCCICDLDQIPSAFRLMVHLRKAHFACDVCLENCFDQSRLSSHVWKHKLHHLCYRCGIAYRNKPDITKHLFWKHGTESVLCKRCLQKRWPHVYHFCIPPINFVCEVCNLTFTRAVYLKVHKRLHSGDAPYPCTEDNCDKKFISRKLLLKHVDEHQQIQSEEKFITAAEPDKTIKEENSIEDKKSDDQPKLKDEKLSSECVNENKEKGEELDVHVGKKKRKKAKRSSEAKETLEDLNLQAPNLSESGSSDDSDTEPPIKQNSLVPNVILSPPSEQDEEDEGKKEASPEKLIDIWNNFKTFQAANIKIEDSGADDSNLNPPTPILHVVQSDHDYCKMFKKSTEKANVSESGIDKKHTAKDKISKLDVLQNGDKNDRSLLLPISPSKRKPKSAKKSHAKSGSDSSSSGGSSSSSDSSCTCGSNCSCSSTTNSSSDSSSSSDSDSSSSEGKKRIAAKRAAKEKRRRNRLQSENSSKANNSDVVDVVTTDLKPEPKLLEPVIYEDDLETDESDTDEDFYDEHPQKLASEILAEKRRQLMKQTCLSPSHNFDIVENSRPSTPSLPEDVYGSINNREKKAKVKKKKHERKASNKNLIPPFKLNISKTNADDGIIKSPFVPPITPKQSNSNGSLVTMSGNSIDFFIPSDDTEMLAMNPITTTISESQITDISSVYHQSPLSTTKASVNYQNVPTSNVISGAFSILTSTQSPEPMSQSYQALSMSSTILNSAVIRPPTHSGPSVFPAPIDPNLIRHSTESSSDASANLLSNADSALKRSKRARRPNRFYGYSSDDETAHNGSLATGGVFKPIPPPNLTWRKEDLPTPPRNSTGKTLKPPALKVSLLSGNKKMKLFSNKKDNSIKKGKQFGSKLIKLGNSSGITKPRIPTLKIKPIDILPQIPPSILDHQPTDMNSSQRLHQPPPVVEPINSLPPVPVHHIDAPQFYPSSKDSIDSDSESDEDKLTIPLQIFNPETSKPVAQTKTTKKASTPKLPKGNQSKTNKNKSKNSINTSRTSYNSVPQAQINNLSSLQNLQREIKEPTPPPKEKRIPAALLPNPDLATLQYFKRNNIRYPIRPPAGARAPREGESVYCYCRCPYDEVSEMIACDGDDCMIEWFHFECVGILVAPQGKWFCAECKPNQQIYSSSQNAILHSQQHQSVTEHSVSSYGNSSINISRFNEPLSNNDNNDGGFSTNSNSMSY